MQPSAKGFRLPWFLKSNHRRCILPILREVFPMHHHLTQKRARKRRFTAVGTLLLFVSVFFISLIIHAKSSEPHFAAAQVSPQIPAPTLEVRSVSTYQQLEKIEPVEDTPEYLYENIPLEPELQELVWQACEESGCPYELALSVIWHESRYQNVNGDGGNSIGYMQIQPKWHQDRMEKLGVTDLSDPLSNFRVGCDLLSELLDKYSVEDALSVYNTGGTGRRSYANKVLSYMGETFG